MFFDILNIALACLNIWLLRKCMDLESGKIGFIEFGDLQGEVKFLRDKLEQFHTELRELQRKDCKPLKEELRTKRAYKRNIWLSTLEATKLLKLPHSTVIRWSKEGYIPYKKSGKKKFMYKQQDLLALNIKEIREKNALEQKKRLLGPK